MFLKRAMSGSAQMYTGRLFQTTIVEDEFISTLPLSIHSAVELLRDSALYKFMIDISPQSRLTGLLHTVIADCWSSTRIL